MLNIKKTYVELNKNKDKIKNISDITEQIAKLKKLEKDFLLSKDLNVQKIKGKYKDEIEKVTPDSDTLVDKDDELQYKKEIKRLKAKEKKEISALLSLPNDIETTIQKFKLLQFKYIITLSHDEAQQLQNIDDEFKGFLIILLSNSPVEEGLERFKLLRESNITFGNPNVITESLLDLIHEDNSINPLYAIKTLILLKKAGIADLEKKGREIIYNSLLKIKSLPKDEQEKMLEQLINLEDEIISLTSKKSKEELQSIVSEFNNILDPLSTIKSLESEEDLNKGIIALLYSIKPSAFKKQLHLHSEEYELKEKFYGIVSKTIPAEASVNIMTYISESLDKALGLDIISNTLDEINNIISKIEENKEKAIQLIKRFDPTFYVQDKSNDDIEEKITQIKTQLTEEKKAIQNLEIYKKISEKPKSGEKATDLYIYKEKPEKILKELQNSLENAFKKNSFIKKLISKNLDYELLELSLHQIEIFSKNVLQQKKNLTFSGIKGDSNNYINSLLSKALKELEKITPPLEKIVEIENIKRKQFEAQTGILKTKIKEYEILKEKLDSLEKELKVLKEKQPTNQRNVKELEKKITTQKNLIEDITTQIIVLNENQAKLLTTFEIVEDIEKRLMENFISKEMPLIKEQLLNGNLTDDKITQIAISMNYAPIKEVISFYISLTEEEEKNNPNIQNLLEKMAEHSINFRFVKSILDKNDAPLDKELSGRLDFLPLLSDLTKKIESSPDDEFNMNILHQVLLLCMPDKFFDKVLAHSSMYSLPLEIKEFLKLDKVKDFLKDNFEQYCSLSSPDNAFTILQSYQNKKQKPEKDFLDTATIFSEELFSELKNIKDMSLGQAARIYKVFEKNDTLFHETKDLILKKYEESIKSIDKNQKIDVAKIKSIAYFIENVTPLITNIEDLEIKLISAYIKGEIRQEDLLKINTILKSININTSINLLSKNLLEGTTKIDKYFDRAFLKNVKHTLNDNQRVDLYKLANFTLMFKKINHKTGEKLRTLIIKELKHNIEDLIQIEEKGISDKEKKELCENLQYVINILSITFKINLKEKTTKHENKKILEQLNMMQILINKTMDKEQEAEVRQFSEEDLTIKDEREQDFRKPIEHYEIPTPNLQDLRVLRIFQEKAELYHAKRRKVKMIRTEDGDLVKEFGDYDAEGIKASSLSTAHMYMNKIDSQKDEDTQINVASKMHYIQRIDSIGKAVEALLNDDYKKYIHKKMHDQGITTSEIEKLKPNYESGIKILGEELISLALETKQKRYLKKIESLKNDKESLQYGIHLLTHIYKEKIKQISEQEFDISDLRTAKNSFLSEKDLQDMKKMQEIIKLNAEFLEKSHKIFKAANLIPKKADKKIFKKVVQRIEGVRVSKEKEREILLRVIKLKDDTSLVEMAIPITDSTSTFRDAAGGKPANYWQHIQVHIDKDGNKISERTISRSSSITPIFEKDGKKRVEDSKKQAKSLLKELLMEKIKEVLNKDEPTIEDIQNALENNIIALNTLLAPVTSMIIKEIDALGDYNENRQMMESYRAIKFIESEFNNNILFRRRMFESVFSSLTKGYNPNISDKQKTNLEKISEKFDDGIKTIIKELSKTSKVTCLHNNSSVNELHNINLSDKQRKINIETKKKLAVLVIENISASREKEEARNFKFIIDLCNNIKESKDGLNPYEWKAYEPYFKKDIKNLYDELQSLKNRLKKSTEPDEKKFFEEKISTYNKNLRLAISLSRYLDNFHKVNTILDGISKASQISSKGAELELTKHLYWQSIHYQEIMQLLGAKVHVTCKSGKDRTGLNAVNTSALMVSMTDENLELLVNGEDEKFEEIFYENFYDIYKTSVNQEIANHNIPGAYGVANTNSQISLLKVKQEDEPTHDDKEKNTIQGMTILSNLSSSFAKSVYKSAKPNKKKQLLKKIKTIKENKGILIASSPLAIPIAYASVIVAGIGVGSYKGAKYLAKGSFEATGSIPVLSHVAGVLGGIAGGIFGGIAGVLAGTFSPIAIPVIDGVQSLRRDKDKKYSVKEAKKKASSQYEERQQILGKEKLPDVTISDEPKTSSKKGKKHTSKKAIHPILEQEEISIVTPSSKSTLKKTHSPKIYFLNHVDKGLKLFAKSKEKIKSKKVAPETHKLIDKTFSEEKEKFRKDFNKSLKPSGIKLITDASGEQVLARTKSLYDKVFNSKQEIEPILKVEVKKVEEKPKSDSEKSTKKEILASTIYKESFNDNEKIKEMAKFFISACKRTGDTHPQITNMKAEQIISIAKRIIEINKKIDDPEINNLTFNLAKTAHSISVKHVSKVDSSSLEKAKEFFKERSRIQSVSGNPKDRRHGHHEKAISKQSRRKSMETGAKDLSVRNMTRRQSLRGSS